MSSRLSRFLTVSGWVLLSVGSIRFYRVLRSHAEDPKFAPHLMVTLLSLWIASSILRVGLRKKALNKRVAITLIRSGSILLMIWSYRFYLSLNASPGTGTAFLLYLSPFYIVFGSIVMCAGLRISRTLRNHTAETVSSVKESLSGDFSEDPLDGSQT
ncbi:MAG: hypothetical protein ABGX83_03580 [Nitrospira sp.]|nr:hypothetical protein [Candidatus Manganitrophaceae bacterium]HIL34261.1 hypothetical protein [Candidatus Manganitrophaceae bacterium]